MEFDHTQDDRDPQNQPSGNHFYQNDQDQLNRAGPHTTTLYIPLQYPQAPNVSQSPPVPSRELLELEHYIHPALVQKSQLESMIAAVDFTATVCIPFPVAALEPMLEFKAHAAFDLLKLSTVIKGRLQQLVLYQADSGALRQQLIMDLDWAWQRNASLVQELTVAARRGNPLSVLATEMEAALSESGLHQAMIST